MFLTIMTVCILSWPTSWVADTNLTIWCQCENVTPAQIFGEFGVLDTIVAIEERSAPNYHHHLPMSTLGERIETYENSHKRKLPWSTLTANKDCRLYSGYHRRFIVEDTCSALEEGAYSTLNEDTCSTVTASIYLIEEPTNMPMVRMTLCLETGLKKYEFMTEHGALVIDESNKTVILFTGGNKYFLWTDPPLDPTDTLPAELNVVTPPDSVCPPANKAGRETH